MRLPQRESLRTSATTLFLPSPPSLVAYLWTPFFYPSNSHFYIHYIVLKIQFTFIKSIFTLGLYKSGEKKSPKSPKKKVEKYFYFQVCIKPVSEYYSPLDLALRIACIRKQNKSDVERLFPNIYARLSYIAVEYSVQYISYRKIL